MTAVLLVAAIAVIGAVIARVTWRRPADERHSIQSHQQTLNTLRSMADRRPGAFRDGATPAAPASKARGAQAPPGATSSGPEPSPPSRSAPARSGAAQARTARSGAVKALSNSAGAAGHDLVFVDDGGATPGPRNNGSPRISPLTPVKGLHRGDRLGRLSRGRPGGAVGRLVPVVTAVVVLGVVVAFAVALAPSHRTTAPGRTHSTTAGHLSSHTTVTTPSQLQPTSSTASTAVYTAPSTGYTVALQATGPCWVDATRASTGAVVWTGTLQSGQTQAVPATGGLVVRLGAANDVTVTLNGVPVVLPAGFQSPFDMHFQAA